MFISDCLTLYKSIYRIYCTGDNVDKDSAKITTIEEGVVYDLVTLKSLVLSHGLGLMFGR